MEPDRFDQLFSQKLSQADSPRYRESDWTYFNRKLPKHGTTFHASTFTLVSLLILSNSFWAWNAYQGHSRSNTPQLAISGSVALSPPSNRAGYENTSLPSTAGFAAEETVQDPNQDLSVAINPDPGVPVTMDSLQLSDQGLSLPGDDETTSYKPGILEDTLMANPDTLIAEEQVRKGPVPVISARTKRPASGFAGNRWALGLEIHKPLLGTKGYAGSGLGLTVGFAATNWLCVHTEISQWNYTYYIDDRQFYDELLEASYEENSNPPGGLYGGDNSSGDTAYIYHGPTYTWQETEVNIKSTQVGMGIILSPHLSTRRIYPYLGVGYLFHFNTRSELTNLLEEDGSSKTIKVETSFPESQSNMHYIRSELGIRGRIKEDLQIAVSGAYWKKLQGSRYESDLKGMRVGLTYFW